MEAISICVICKNEEKNMDTFLSRIVQFTKACPVETVIVDTGSTDRTPEIISRYPVRLLHFDWINDFSAARNYSIKQAKNDWILVLDCDEYLEELDFDALQLFIQQHPTDVGVLFRKNHFYNSEGGESVAPDDVERFFNRKHYHYEAIIHEQVCALNGKPYTRIRIPITVDHGGYVGSLEELKQKAQRNDELLLKMLEANPDDPYVYFQLGQSANLLHDDEKACYYYGKALEYDLDPHTLYVQLLVNAYGYCLLHLERYEEALQFENIYDEFATNADFCLLMGLIYLRTGNVLKAMAEFYKATTFETAHVEGANSYIPTFNMALINELMGDKETAITLYQKCGNYPKALERLQEIEKTTQP